MKLTKAPERFNAVNVSATLDQANCTGDAGIIVLTGQAIPAAQAGIFNLQIRNPEIAAMGNGQAMILVNVRYGTATQGIPVVSRVTINQNVGQATISLVNVDPALATNGTLEVNYVIFN